MATSYAIPTGSTKDQLDFNTGRIDRNLTASPAQTSINSQSLTPQPSFNLTPPKPASEAAGFQGYMEMSANQLAQQQQQVRESRGDLFDAMIKSDTETGLQDTLYAQQVDPAEAELNDINNQILAEQHSTRRQIEALQKNPQGLFGGALQDKIDEIETKSTAKQADLAIVQLSKQGKFDSAKRIADRAVTAMLEKQKLRNDALRFNYEENKDLFDKNEQRIFEFMQGERERSLENEEYRLRQEFDQKIKQADPLYQAQLANTYSQINERNNKSSLGGTLNGKPQTTTQATIQGYADRVTQSDKIISALGSKFTGALSVVGQLNPFNILKSSERQQYEQAQRNYVNAVLRRESGAVISEEEFANARQQYFPQAGDSPEVVAQKAANRATVKSNLYQAANVFEPVEPGTVIEADGKRYQVGDDGETLIEL